MNLNRDSFCLVMTNQVNSNRQYLGLKRMLNEWTYIIIQDSSKNIRRLHDEYSRMIEDLMEKAKLTGEMIGRFKAVEPLLNFIVTGEGSPEKIQPLMLQLFSVNYIL